MTNSSPLYLRVLLCVNKEYKRGQIYYIDVHNRMRLIRGGSYSA